MKYCYTVVLLIKMTNIFVLLQNICVDIRMVIYVSGIVQYRSLNIAIFGSTTKYPSLFTQLLSVILSYLYLPVVKNIIIFTHVFNRYTVNRAEYRGNQLPSN